MRQMEYETQYKHGMAESARKNVKEQWTSYKKNVVLDHDSRALPAGLEGTTKRERVGLWLDEFGRSRV